MKILVVAATSFEIRPFRERLTSVNDRDEWLMSGRMEGASVDLLLPGVGMMATAFHLGRQLLKEKYDLAINAGICGSFDHSITIGDVVEVAEDHISDLGAEGVQRFLTVFDLGIADPDTPPFIRGSLINRSEIKSGILRGLPRVRGATVNRIPGNRSNNENPANQYSPEIETMEGAAFLYACLVERISCTQIRAVSNFVEERDKANWDVRLAVKNLNHVLFDFVEEQIRE